MAASVVDRPLTNLERRIIANLSIPRNQFDLTRVLREDAAARVPQLDLEADDTFADLINAGFIVGIGEHDAPGKIAAAMDRHKQAIGIPTEKAKIYEARLRMSHRSWRAKGQQWVMTEDGFAKLHDPSAIGDPEPLPTPVVEQFIREQSGRIYRGGNPSDGPLGERMLEEEYAAWVKAVVTGHEKLTGEKPAVPVAGGAGYADATETLIIDPENAKGSAYTETAPWFMAAVTVAITDADTGSTITEATYTGYARKSVAALDMNAAASPGGSATNANAITFANCTAGTAAVIGFGKCVAATVGRLIKYGTCTLVNVSSTQQPLSFAAAAFTTSVD